MNRAPGAHDRLHVVAVAPQQPLERQLHGVGARAGEAGPNYHETLGGDPRGGGRGDGHDETVARSSRHSKSSSALNQAVNFTDRDNGMYSTNSLSHPNPVKVSKTRLVYFMHS